MLAATITQAINRTTFGPTINDATTAQGKTASLILGGTLWAVGGDRLVCRIIRVAALPEMSSSSEGKVTRRQWLAYPLSVRVRGEKFSLRFIFFSGSFFFFWINLFFQSVLFFHQQRFFILANNVCVNPVGKRTFSTWRFASKVSEKLHSFSQLYTWRRTMVIYIILR